MVLECDHYKLETLIGNTLIPLYRETEKIGEHTKRFVYKIVEDKLEQAISIIYFVLDLTTYYQEEEIEKAARRSVFYRKYDYEKLRLILREHLTQLPLDDETNFLGQSIYAEPSA